MSFNLSHVINDLNTKSKVEYFHYHKGNTGLSLNASDFSKRTDTRMEINLPHVTSATGTKIGCFDQVFVLEHSFNVPITASIHASYFDTVSNSVKWMYTISERKLVAAGRLTFTPESSVQNANIVEVPELRQAIPLFQVVITFPNGAASTGEFNIFLTRRY